jgi:iron complex outermembrane receptor protein
LGSGWNLAFGGMYYHSTGDIQSIGWNRVTQALIDSGTYITGRDTTLVDLDGNGYLTPNETGGSLSKSYSGTTPVTDARFTLDTGVGTTKLSPRNIFISSYDFSTTHTSTAYLDIGKTLSDTSSVKLQFFYDELSNDRFVSYGFPASYRSEVYESRLSYNFELSALDNFLVAKSVVGASYRHFQGVQKESYYSGRSAANRRDLSVGPTPTDIFDSPFSIEPGGISLTWETDLHGKWDDLGAYALTNLSFGEKLNLLLGGRYDDYHVQSQDVGTIVYTTKNRVKDSKGNFTYSASLSYKAPLGLMPYVTYAKSDALNLEQAGNLAVSTITSGQWLGKGELTEGGVKFQLLSNTLVGSLAAYDQQRTDVVGITRAIQGARAKGVELELRYLATKNFSFTYVANSQHTKIKGPDGAYYALSPEAVGISPALGYGGAFSGQMGAYPGRAGDYDYSLTPHSVQSLYGAFTTDVESWGQGGVTVGVTHATKTSQLITNPVVFPAYTVANASAFYSKDGYTVSLNIDNLFDKLYFTPNVDSPANTSVRPSTGREFRVKLQKSF